MKPNIIEGGVTSPEFLHGGPLGEAPGYTKPREDMRGLHSLLFFTGKARQGRSIAYDW